MAKTLAQLQQQIEALQREADAIRNRDRKEVIARIQEAITQYGFTPADLGFGAAKRVATAQWTVPAKTNSKRKSNIKYRDSAGNEWSGRGRRPRWFMDAIASGKTADQLAA